MKFLTAICIPVIALTGVYAQTTFDAKVLGDLRVRHLGPSVMSGRIACIDAVNQKPGIIYAGTAGGGVWKSLDFGVTYKPVFDKYNQSIGAITINQQKPNEVWAGTGETWTRNSVSAGDGIYFSSDGGDSWKKTGLEKSERISKIIIDPANAGTIYVAVTGALWSDSEERGLYKTTDGGQNWKKILYINPGTGCADVCMDPSDPNTLLASMWEFRRTAFSFNSGGKNSCIMKSTDGGNTWKKLTTGLPAGDLGRIALDFSKADAKTVYATIESKETAMYRSNDKGETWTRTGTHNFIIERPFYFSKIITDPKDPERVYRAGLNMLVSTDGGKSFNEFRGGAHGDYHDLWINPQNPENILVATDGGVYTSYDRGAHFYQHRNLPVGQFYHVSYDLEENYNVYGGLQDNGSWMGPAKTQTWSMGNRNWNTVGWGDGFWVVPDPSDNNYVYSESQGGELQRYFKPTKTAKSIKPVELEGQPRYRYNWNSPIATSPTRKQVLYYGAQYLLKSENKGESWVRISPDLTTNNPEKQKQDKSGGLSYDNSSAENHCTIYTICESTKNENVIWVGTDDGNLQLTRDGGKTWNNMIKNVLGLPSPAWVSTVECSRFEEGVAYVSFDRHTNGDFNSYVYVTRDFGQTWKRLGENQLKGYAHVVREDNVTKDMLFCGTENGLFISLDAGQSWFAFDHNQNMPPVAVRDIQIHPVSHDLIMATHGRGILILDDIRILRQLNTEVLNKPLHIFPIASYAYKETGFDYILFGDDEFQAPNPKTGFSFNYYLQKKHMGGEFIVQLLDEKNEILQTKTAGKRKGINTMELDLQRKPPQMPPAPKVAYAGFIGAPLPEGNYRIRMIRDADTLLSAFKIIHDEKSQHNRADKQERMNLIMQLHTLCNNFTYTVISASDLQKGAEEAMLAKSCTELMRKQLLEYVGALKSLHDKVVDTQMGMISDSDKFLRDKLSNLYAQVVNYEGKPSATQAEKTVSIQKEIEALEKQLGTINDKHLPKINEGLKKSGIRELSRMNKETFLAMGK